MRLRRVPHLLLLLLLRVPAGWLLWVHPWLLLLLAPAVSVRLSVWLLLLVLGGWRRSHARVRGGEDGGRGDWGVTATGWEYSWRWRSHQRSAATAEYAATATAQKGRARAKHSWRECRGGRVRRKAACTAIHRRIKARGRGSA